MKKRSGAPASSPGDGPQHLAAIESNVFSKLHSLVAHCSVTRYDDGDPRVPGWFTIKTVGASWVVQLKEPDTCLQLQVHGQTLDDALALADLLLSSDEAPWEPDPWARANKAKSKK